MEVQLLNDFDRVLQELTNVLDQLMGVLKEERDAIIDYDLGQIADTYKKKHEILLRIRMLEASKNEIVKKLGASLSCDKEPSLKFVLEKIPDQVVSERIYHHLSCIKSLSQAAQEFNLIQREYIAYSLLSVQSSIAALDVAMGRLPQTYYNSAGLQGNKDLRTSAGAVMNRNV